MGKDIGGLATLLVGGGAGQAESDGCLFICLSNIHFLGLSTETPSDSVSGKLCYLIIIKKGRSN